MNSVIIAGYHLSEQLYNGYRNLVYRGVRKADSLPVVIKVLKNPYPSFSELVQFRNQYTIAKNLNHPGIIQTYSLEPYRNGYTLVMEDFGGISLKDYLTNNNNTESLDEFLQIAIDLTTTLDYLIRYGIIHKDIKPANILINPKTKQVKLIDFSIASLLPRETQTLISPNTLEGTLAYISPEQTGRINRGIDYRTDFYSLGVTFYELLTKQLPFQSEDAMELVHYHIAKTAPSVHEINSNIPYVLSEIVSKLMAKNASDRYQSALGLKYDLEKCWEQLKQTGSIESFPIAKWDVCARFVIPEKLYGREEEANQLLAAFERVAQGNSELMLVTGFSGIGKTAVVNEVHKPIVRQRGYFIKGKYDQFNRNIPFSAFLQAFRDLMGQLLTEDDTKLQQWQDKIIKALGENAQVLIQVIPELERIIGSQPPATELSGMAAQNRFNLLFQKFIQLFTNKEHPLVIFLDDLQWADSASLKLMQLLMDESDKGYLFLIGAYRDHEVFPGHPLILTLDEIAHTGVKINNITLSPLSTESVNQLVADTLNCQLERAQPLTQLVYQKTKGNPFFTTQFLVALHEDNYIQFNFPTGHWQCDIAQIKQLAFTDDVVEFMAQQLGKLGTATQYVLKLAACIGNQFDLATLAIVSEQSQTETATALWKALQFGLILPINEVYKFYVGQENQAIDEQIAHTVGYKFLHDRVQQAAYSLIPEEQKQATHVKIGRLLWQNIPEGELENQIFAIVNQLNIGLEQFDQLKERYELSQLNLIAGKKAKASTAYSSALAYLKIARELLPLNPWQSDYDQTLNLYSQATEVSYLCGEMGAMESFALEILQHAKAITDTAKVYEVKIEAYTVQGKLLEAIDTAMQFLERIGIEFPKEPTDEDFVLALQETQAALSGKIVAELVDLPEMQNLELRAALGVLVKLDVPAYLAKPELHRLVILKRVTLCVKYGNSSASAFAYSAYGLMLCGQVETIPIGYEFGQLALQLLRKFPDQEHEARTLFMVDCFITHWKEHLTSTLKPLLTAYTSALDSGNLAYAGYATHIHCFHAYIASEELTQLANKLATYGAVIEKINQKNALNYNNIYHQVVLNLIDSKTNPWELVGAAYDERLMLALHEQTNDSTGLWHFYVNKLILCYLFQELDLAIEYTAKAKQYSRSGYATAIVPLLNFYDSLLLLALFPKSSDAQQQKILQQVAENQKIMQQWANFAHVNHLHRFQLVEAEKYRVLGQKTTAIEFYDQAIDQAKENGYVQEAALGNELAAKFCLEWGKERVAQGYIEQAYYCYARWGAKTKVEDLQQRYPELLQIIVQQKTLKSNPYETLGNSLTTTTSNHTSTYISSSSNSSINSVLDFASVLKASQAISTAIELDELIQKLIQIILENSGADRCVLILFQDGLWQVRAITTLEGTILQTVPLDNHPDVPIPLIQYVKNTLETVVIDDLKANLPNLIGEYMLQHQPKSILCMPIRNQGQLLGILYLENRVTTGAFMGDSKAQPAKRNSLDMLQLLTAQAAISLENALLYKTLEDKVEQRTQELHKKNLELSDTLNQLQHTQAQLIHAEKMSSLGQMVAGIAHEINNPITFIYGNITCLREYFQELLDGITLYQRQYPQPTTEIEAYLKSTDLDYLRKDLPKVLDSIKQGSQRIQDIVLSLRNFARLDEADIKPVNIHEGIENTLLILQHQLSGIDIIRDYAELPQVNCHAKQINQVIMNILNNAIDALNEAKITTPIIRIRTELKNSLTNNVSIRIADNGTGISEEVQKRAFDPFFTTKPVGKGKGLGLAVAYSVIASHGGQINITSKLGQGSEFQIILPILG
ncbi:trifunctional serine/threonine-protein kinase/ATP-binding protein/sensor histidine kinase [Aetokthonos hydrillicola Thurmond2011]|jgi:predicted ATPase/signal transduction histidine kinase|uniref:histidine kinase n=1 Tax=Aetokthonos hydrillicola Thurmond2011 TaxID=2712845 RepID=A0AAP5M9T8_9CYAN|nr:ATP-binding sensor histidine kinase [Aetokthonos hydrillicola]MBO3460232.1 AAA family ATPase [Aetokthonos hydrillicola CCALA 1050]MBW4586965.1 AAA family ATPase [Aetokthonos hydrillicola CCALA 1050]MDR9897560.1 trifunctional serine/threonine-protein kinase/ATP-binding protein/sensor histidine kinase [Aetokthonos hydrillicola Thurmond2011]